MSLAGELVERSPKGLQRGTPEGAQGDPPCRIVTPFGEPQLDSQFPRLEASSDSQTRAT